jgi:hypothetical protein
VYPHARIADDLSAQGLWRFSSPIVDLLAVRWVMAPRDRPIGEPGFLRRFAGDDGIDLWENLHALPYAFVVYRAQPVADEAAAARAIAEPGFRPGTDAIVEEPLAGVPAPALTDAPPPAELVSDLSRPDSERLVIDATLRAPGVLVVGEPYSPGWQARVDGEPARLLRVDYALSGLALLPGRHRVELLYVDEPLGRGAAVTGVALLALCALTLFARARKSRLRG